MAAEIVRRRVFADFTVAHVMRFRQGRATGDIMLSPAMLHDQGCTVHRYCKLNVMLNLCEKGNLDPQRVLAVGDGENDVCMLAAAGTRSHFGPNVLRWNKLPAMSVAGLWRKFSSLCSNVPLTQGRERRVTVGLWAEIEGSRS